MRKKKKTVKFDLLNPKAAGIDVGSKNNWACVASDIESAREFGVFTEDHHELASWLQESGVTTVAMESTGIYWKALHVILESYGLEVLVANAADVKNIRGKKNDAHDSQWICQLHSAGLLKGSFQPDSFTSKLRVYTRHRKSLVFDSSRFISRMQKEMVQMNIQLSVVLTDITGKSGRRIIEAILSGEREGKELAKLADGRVKASKEQISKALTGEWSDDHLFALRQCWQMYESYQAQIGECDKMINKLLEERLEETGQNDLAYTPVKKKRSSKNSLKIDVPQYAFQLSDGIDLTEVNGIGHDTLITLMAEVGLDLAQKFPSSKHFTSWMSLCPNKRITGGKVLSSRTKNNKNRLAQAFRHAANAVGRQRDTPLSDFFARLAYRKGRKIAITATARKLAVIVYNMLTKGEAFSPLKMEEYKEQQHKRMIRRMQRNINKFGLTQADLEFS